jgi:hypothetical protein
MRRKPEKIRSIVAYFNSVPKIAQRKGDKASITLVTTVRAPIDIRSRDVYIPKTHVTKSNKHWYLKIKLTN